MRKYSAQAQSSSRFFSAHQKNTAGLEHTLNVSTPVLVFGKVMPLFHWSPYAIYFYVWRSRAATAVQCCGSWRWSNGNLVCLLLGIADAS